MNGMFLTGDASAFDVSTGLETATSLVSWVFEVMSANPVLTAVFVVGTVVPCGIGLFSYLKHTVK